MLRLFLYLAGIIAIASGLAWLADRPGNLVINWEGHVVETSVFYAIVILSALIGAALLVWSILRHIWESPAAIGSFMNRRREKKGLDALSSGMIAIGAGDRAGATRYAIQARKTLPNEPLTHLLRAQAAHLSGDKATARRIYEGMLNTPDTEQLGLRGLFLEAQKEGELEAARQFAERAVRENPKLGWAVDALFELQCKEGDWAGALETVSIARKNGHIEKASAERRKAVLMTAQAQKAEDTDPERALSLAMEAHKLAPGLVPAAAIAGRILASRGSTPKATSVLQKTWQKSPHPDLAVAYAYSRLGDSPADRLQRVKKLAALNPYSLESPIAVANAAIEAKDWQAAREALEPLLESRLTQRVCTLMARVEGEQHGDKGRVREWLARAVNAPRDPAWTADGVVSDTWAPVSPVTGALDAFQWKVPVEAANAGERDLIAQKLEELVALGAPSEGIEARRDIDGSAASAAAGVATAASGAAAAAAAPETVKPSDSGEATAKTPTASPKKADVTEAEIVETPAASNPAAERQAEKAVAAVTTDSEPGNKPAPSKDAGQDVSADTAGTAEGSRPSQSGAAKDAGGQAGAEKAAGKDMAEKMSQAATPGEASGGKGAGEEAATSAKKAAGETKTVVAVGASPGKPEAAASDAQEQVSTANAPRPTDSGGGNQTDPAVMAAKPDPAKPGTSGQGSAAPSRTAANQKDNPGVFVPMRAPDDPGPGGNGVDPPAPTRPTYPMTKTG